MADSEYFSPYRADGKLVHVHAYALSLTLTTYASMASSALSPVLWAPLALRS